MRRSSSLGQEMQNAAEMDKAEKYASLKQFNAYDARPADTAYGSAQYCFDQYKPTQRQAAILRQIESYEHALVVHDKWIPPASLVSNWLCRLIERIAESFHCPPNTQPTKPAMIVVVGSTRIKAHNLLGTFYSFVDFPKLYRATGYDVLRIYHTGNEINAVQLHNKRNESLPQIEVHACTPQDALGYSRGICGIFIDGFGEFVSTPGVIDRCLMPFIGRIQNDDVARSLCALVSVYDGNSARLANELQPGDFGDVKRHKWLAEVAAVGGNVEEKCRFVCRAVTQAVVDKITFFYIQKEVERIKKRVAKKERAKGLQNSRARSATVVGRRLPTIFETPSACRYAEDDTSVGASESALISPRPTEAAPDPPARQILRRATVSSASLSSRSSNLKSTLEKVKAARRDASMSLRAATTSPPPLPPPPSLVDHSYSATRLPSRDSLIPKLMRKDSFGRMFDSSSDDTSEDLYYGDVRPHFFEKPPSRGASSSSPPYD